jgi:hypothetical protein
VTFFRAARKGAAEQGRGDGGLSFGPGAPLTLSCWAPNAIFEFERVEAAEKK